MRLNIADGKEQSPLNIAISSRDIEGVPMSVLVVDVLSGLAASDAGVVALAGVFVDLSAALLEAVGKTPQERIEQTPSAGAPELEEQRDVQTAKVVVPAAVSKSQQLWNEALGVRGAEIEALGAEVVEVARPRFNPKPVGQTSVEGR